MPKPRRREIFTSNQSDNNQSISQINDDTFLVTAQQFERKAFEEAMYNFENKSNFRSVQFNESSTSVNFTIDQIDNLALNAQNDLNKIIQINNIIRYFVNKNDILGKVYEAIETNVNPQWNLTFENYNEEEKETYDEVKTRIEDFNKKIDLNKLIVDSIPLTYLEGNHIMYLRKDSKNLNYHIDSYPLGVVEIADYSEGGEPYILVNVAELRSRLQKIYKKDKKNKPLFYKSMDEEIKAIYPKEVYDAFKNKEQYAKLNIENTGVMRIGNYKRKYGLSPIFKSLKPTIRLDNIEKSDDQNTLVRGKKIIFQKLIKEIITQTKDIPNITWSSAQARAHNDLMLALKSTGTSVYTGLPWTESIEYVEPKLEQTNVQTKNSYRNQIMTSIGISFLSADKGSYGSAEISIKELKKMIDKISDQLQLVLQKWYRGILVDNGIDVSFCPNITVINSEQLATDVKIQLIDLLYSKLNCSYETAYKIAGIDIQDEYMRREKETEEGYDKIFVPHLNGYTANGDAINNAKSGRPKSNEDKNKQEYDEDYKKQNQTSVVEDGDNN